jgi:hypothetical protein
MRTQGTTIFDFLNNILKQKSIQLMKEHIADDLFEKSYSIYMINRYISMHINPEISQVILSKQKELDVLSPSSHYRYLMRLIPQTNSSFITYIK